MPTAYSTAAHRQNSSPGVKPKLPPRRVSSPTPHSATAALIMLAVFGSLRMIAASISGTNTIAVFSRNDTVDVSVVLSAVSSKVMTAVNTAPIIAPPIISRRLACLSLRKNIMPSTTKPRRKRAARRLNVPSVSSPVLLKRYALLRVSMTAARSSSACFLLIYITPVDISIIRGYT